MKLLLRHLCEAKSNRSEKGGERHGARSVVTDTGVLAKRVLEVRKHQSSVVKTEVVVQSVHVQPYNVRIFNQVSVVENYNLPKVPTVRRSSPFAFRGELRWQKPLHQGRVGEDAFGVLQLLTHLTQDPWRLPRLLLL